MSGNRTTSLRRQTVLLVEDDANDILLFQRAFQKVNLNSTLQVVEDGAKALDYLLGQGRFQDRDQYAVPSLIVLDLKLPRKSGFEVLAWVRSAETLRRIPVVVFTSSRETRDVNMAFDLGANSYLVKPSGFEALLESVRLLWTYWLMSNELPEVRLPAPVSKERADA